MRACLATLPLTRLPFVIKVLRMPLDIHWGHVCPHILAAADSHPVPLTLIVALAAPALTSRSLQRLCWAKLLERSHVGNKDTKTIQKPSA